MTISDAWNAISENELKELIALLLTYLNPSEMQDMVDAMQHINRLIQDKHPDAAPLWTDTQQMFLVGSIKTDLDIRFEEGYATFN